MTGRRRNLLARFIVVDCACPDGPHYIDMLSHDLSRLDTGVYACDDCGRPLLCFGGDGAFYYVGGKV